MWSESQIKVRYVETDQMGVVHHSNYFAWFEVGRTDFLEKTGFHYQSIEKSGVMMPVIEANCIYRAPARYGDVLTIKTRIAKLKRFKIEFEYEVHEAKRGLLATGITILGSVDSNSKPTPFPDALFAKLQSQIKN